MSEKYLPLSGVKGILRECLPEDELFEMTELISAVTPVVHGHWKNKGCVLSVKFGKCSNCECIHEATRYCPYSGAKMDEEVQV